MAKKLCGKYFPADFADLADKIKSAQSARSAREKLCELCVNLCVFAVKKTSIEK